MHCIAAFHRLALLLAAILLFSAPAIAAEESVFFTGGGVSKEAPGDPAGIYVNAAFTMHLPTSVSESLHRGISLYFNTEFSLAKRRWYWKARPVITASITRRLSYSLLTHKYHLGGDGLSQSFSTLDEALAVLSSVRRWKVAPPNAISGDFQDYTATICLSLDKSRLPKPLQFSSSDWDMTSDWAAIPISPSVASPS